MTNFSSPKRSKQDHQDIYKAAQLSSDWQSVWKDFLEAPTPALARSVVSKGNDLLAEQSRLAVTMQPSGYIKHRVLVAEDYLTKNSKQVATSAQSEATRKIQQLLDGLKR